MKIANVAHTGFRSGTRLPRGWVVIGAALAAWFIFAAAGTMMVHIFSMILAHI